MATTFVETYLGCDIYFYTPPTVPYDQYGSPCLVSNYVTFTAVKKRICLSKGGTWDGSTCTIEPEEPEEEDTFIESFMGCDIFYTTRILIGGVPGAYYSEYGGQYRSTLSEAKGDICERNDGTWNGTTCIIEPEEPSLKHTALSIGVWPTSGTTPYDVTITAALISGGEGLPDKEIFLYKDDVHIDSGLTDEDGIVVFTDTVTDSASYRASFVSDGVYEGADSEEAGPGATAGRGLGILILLGLLLGGRKK